MCVCLGDGDADDAGVIRRDVDADADLDIRASDLPMDIRPGLFLCEAEACLPTSEEGKVYSVSCEASSELDLICPES